MTVKPPLTAINGPTNYSAAVGQAFAVEASVPGYTPIPTLTEAGTLPEGVTFVSNGPGDSFIEGTTSKEGVYPITVTADDGIEPAFTKAITLTVAPPSVPAFTSVPGTTVQVGTPFSFTVTSSGSPSPAISAVSLTSDHGRFPPPPFPNGVGFNTSGDGTALIAGTVETAGTYQTEIDSDR